MPLRPWLAALAALAWAVPCVAQDEQPARGSWFREHVRLAGEASASMSTSDAEAEGWFNYADYETSTLRSVRLSLVGEVTLSPRVAVLAEVRTIQFEHPEAYALYVRLRPWLAHDFDIHLGRVPPTFGAFPRRAYIADNPLIGMPLAYQYLTAARGDALPASGDELAGMRARGWLVNYTRGNTAEAEGLPIVNALRWDTGVQVRYARGPVTTYGAVTQGTLGDPRLADDNGQPQLAARAVFTPHPIVTVGASVASGPYLRDALAALLPEGRALTSYRQQAVGTDVEVSRDRWLVRSEIMWNRWSQPTFDQVASRHLGARSAFVEARYKLWPGLFIAGRADRLGFTRIMTTAGPVTWDAPVTRVELGGGWALHRHVLLKAAWQRNRRDGGRVRASDVGAVQVVTWF